MATYFLIKRGDTSPSLDVQLQNYLRKPVTTLAGSSIVFSMRNENGTVVVNRSPATLVDAATGTVRYNWLEGDTQYAGTMQGEFEVTFPSGKVETYPKARVSYGNFIPIIVTDDIS